MTLGSGLWTLRAAAVRLHRMLAAHLAGPAVPTWPPAVTSVLSTHRAGAHWLPWGERVQLPGQPEVGGQGFRQEAELLAATGSEAQGRLILACTGEQCPSPQSLVSNEGAGYGGGGER